MPDLDIAALEPGELRFNVFELIVRLRKSGLVSLKGNSFVLPSTAACQSDVSGRRNGGLRIFRYDIDTR